MTEHIDFSGRTIRDISFENAKIVGANLQNTRLSGMINGLVVNDIEVAPLINAELNRLYPERTKLRPMDIEGCREAVRTLEGLLETTYVRAEALTEEQRNERVEDEWSCVESLRHVVMVIDPGKRIGWGSHGWDGTVKPGQKVERGVQYQLIKYSDDWDRWDRKNMKKAA